MLSADGCFPVELVSGVRFSPAWNFHSPYVIRVALGIPRRRQIRMLYTVTPASGSSVPIQKGAAVTGGMNLGISMTLKEHRRMGADADHRILAAD